MKSGVVEWGVFFEVYHILHLTGFVPYKSQSFYENKEDRKD